MTNPVKSREPTHKWSLEVVVLIGMAAGAAVCFCIGIVIETFLVEKWRPPGEPQLSNGQQFQMMICLSAVLGASCAAAGYLDRSKTPNWLTGSVMAMPILVLLAVAVFWALDAGRNGLDLSHWSTYPPVMVASLICAALNPILLSIHKHRPLID